MTREELDKDMIESIEMWLRECEPHYVEKELVWLKELRTRLIEEETPNDIEEAADEYEKKHTYQRYDGGGLTPEYNATLAEAVIFGAKWQKEQMMMELSEKIAYAYQLGLADKEKQMVKEAEKPCHTVEEWMEHIKNADQLTKDIFSKGPYNVLYDALNHPYRDCYDAIKEFGELCYQTARQDMMKEAVEGTYNNSDWGVPCIDLPSPLELERFDKVRIVIVKED